jgi:hypothetical protein
MYDCIVAGDRVWLELAKTNAKKWYVEQASRLSENASFFEAKKVIK